MAQLNPYVNFPGNTREAMTFYKECFGGELHLQTIGGSPAEAHCPAGMKDQIMHSSLTAGDVMIMASDMVGLEGLKPGNNIAMSVNCSSDEEIDTLFGRMSAGGTVLEPLKDTFWGARFGMITDKFGIRWMFNYQKK